MARTGTFPVHDRHMGGRLADLLRAWRAETPPVSYETIAYRLRTEHGLSISTSQVRRWCKSYELEPERAAG